jgi:hypothetical protein
LLFQHRSCLPPFRSSRCAKSQTDMPLGGGRFSSPSVHPSPRKSSLAAEGAGGSQVSGGNARGRANQTYGSAPTVPPHRLNAAGDIERIGALGAVVDVKTPPSRAIDGGVLSGADLLVFGGGWVPRDERGPIQGPESAPSAGRQPSPKWNQAGDFGRISAQDLAIISLGADGILGVSSTGALLDWRKAPIGNLPSTLTVSPAQGRGLRCRVDPMDLQ